jgi:hypothetical protein
LKRERGGDSVRDVTITWYLYAGSELLDYGWSSSLDVARNTARSVALYEGGDRAVITVDLAGQGEVYREEISL